MIEAEKIVYVKDIKDEWVDCFKKARNNIEMLNLCVKNFIFFTIVFGKDQHLTVSDTKNLINTILSEFIKELDLPIDFIDFIDLSGNR